MSQRSKVQRIVYLDLCRYFRFVINLAASYFRASQFHLCSLGHASKFAGFILLSTRNHDFEQQGYHLGVQSAECLG